MNCSACYKTVPLNSCSDEVVIGTFAPNEDFYVYLEIIATGNIMRLAATSDNDGILSIDTSEINFATTLEYKLWVTLQSANNQYGNVIFTSDDVEGITCLLLNFKKVMDGDTCCLCIDSQTIIVIPPEMPITEFDFIDQTPIGTTYPLLVGVVDGVNTRFTVSEGIYKSKTLRNYVNGQLIQQGATWVETTPGSGTWDFLVAPFVGTVITSIYQKP